MQKVRAKLTQEIADLREDLRDEKQFQFLKNQVQIWRSRELSAINDGTRIDRRDPRALQFTMILQSLPYNKERFRDLPSDERGRLTFLHDVVDDEEDNSMEKLIAFLEIFFDSVPHEYHDPAAVVVIVNPNGRVTFTTFVGFTHLQMINYFLSYLFERSIAEFAMMERTVKIRKHELELDAMEDLYDKTDINAIRKRMASALHWLERPEVMNTADMSEDLVMGLDKATTMVLMNVPDLEAIPEEEAMTLFANGHNKQFTTLFADLVAKQINTVRFFEGIRASFDRNHTRVRIIARSIFNAMKKFSYRNGKIVNPSRPHRRMIGLDRLDFC